MIFSFSFSAVFLDRLEKAFFKLFLQVSHLMRVSDVSLDTLVNVYIKVPYVVVRDMCGHRKQQAIFFLREQNFRLGTVYCLASLHCYSGSIQWLSLMFIEEDNNSRLQWSQDHYSKKALYTKSLLL